MTRTRRALSWLAVALAAAAAARHAGAACDGWPAVDTLLRDDAFYEFTWACNLVRGQWPSVSDGTSTSGVQPLWCLLLAWLSSGQPQAIADIAVVLGVCCHVAGGLSFAIAGRGGAAGWCAALLWLGNPLLLRECQSGQETALAALLGALLWHRRHGGERAFAALSVLAVFARTELWLFAAGLALLRGRRRGVGAVLAPLCALAAWLLWNRALGGGWLPDSAAPMAWLAHANFAAAAGDDAAAFWRRGWWFLRPVGLGAPYATASAPLLGALFAAGMRHLLPASLRGLPLAAVALAAVTRVADLETAWWAAGLCALPARGARRTPPALLWAAVFAVAVVALHWAVRWYPRDYYLAPLLVGGAAAVRHWRRHPFVLCALAAAACLRAPLPREPLQHQRALAIAAVAAPVLLPAGERLGSFNSGVLAFGRLLQTPPSLAIVNLDGVVDARAFAALQRGELAAWLDREGIRFVADHPVQFALDPRLPHACGHWFGGGFAPERDLVALARCVVPGVDAERPGTDAVVIAWRRGRGAMPELPALARQLGRLDDGSPVLAWPAQRGEQLAIEQPDGALAPCCTAADDGLHVLAPRPRELGTGRVFVVGAAAPCLLLRP